MLSKAFFKAETWNLRLSSGWLDTLYYLPRMRLVAARFSRGYPKCTGKNKMPVDQHLPVRKQFLKLAMDEALMARHKPEASWIMARRNVQQAGAVSPSLTGFYSIDDRGGSTHVFVYSMSKKRRDGIQDLLWPEAVLRRPGAMLLLSAACRDFLCRKIGCHGMCSRYPRQSLYGLLI